MKYSISCINRIRVSVGNTCAGKILATRLLIFQYGSLILGNRSPGMLNRFLVVFVLKMEVFVVMNVPLVCYIMP